MTDSLADGTLLSQPERSKLARFVRDIEAFIDAHWQPSLPQRFHDALLRQGWTVVRWPEAQGGTGWTQTQLWLWERALAHAGADAGDRLTLDGIGPLLCALPEQSVLEAELDAIRRLERRWVWLDATTALDCEAELHDGYLRLSAPFVPGLMRAERALVKVVPAEAEADPWLLQLDLTLPGCRCQPVTTLGSAAGEELVDGALDVELPLASTPRLAVGAAGEQAVASAGAMLTTLTVDVIGSGALARLTTDLEQAFELDEDLERALTSARIDLLGLEAIERRLLGIDRSAPEYGPLELLRRHRGVQLRQRLDDLAVQALGYFALPAAPRFPGANEPPPGPGGAASRVAAALRGRGLAIADEGEFRRLDGIARALGLVGALAHETDVSPSLDPGQEG